MIVLDTNVAIHYLQGRTDVVQWIDKMLDQKEIFAISTITIVELLGFPRISPDEMIAIEQWIKYLLSVDVDISVSREAARIRRELKLTTSDSIIAATAVLLNASLASFDVAFKKIRDVKIIKPA